MTAHRRAARLAAASATLVAAALGFAPTATAAPAPLAANPCSFSSQAALNIINNRPGIDFNANPNQDIYDTASGLQVEAGNGRMICLQPNMLNGLYALGGKFSQITVTSFATGQHSSGSYHYVGQAADFGTVNGKLISDDVPGDANDTPTASERALLDQCAALGADEIIGPGQPGHDDHIHCAWKQ